MAKTTDIDADKRPAIRGEQPDATADRVKVGPTGPTDAATVAGQPVPRGDDATKDAGTFRQERDEAYAKIGQLQLKIQEMQRRADESGDGVEAEMLRRERDEARHDARVLADVLDGKMDKTAMGVHAARARTYKTGLTDDSVGPVR